MAHLVEDEGKAEKAASKKHKKRKKRRSSSRQRDEERKRADAGEELQGPRKIRTPKQEARYRQM